MLGKRRVKTRTLENRKGAAPKFVSADQDRGMRPHRDEFTAKKITQEKTRTLENHKGAAPKFVSARQGYGTRASPAATALLGFLLGGRFD